MSALGSLVVKLGLEYAEYTGGLSKTEQATLATAKRVQDTFDSMGRKVAATAGAIAGGLAAGFAIGAFKNLLAGVIETGARLDDLRMQTGETVEALSGLLAIGKFNDMGADQLGSMMTKLATNMAGATEESKGASKALQTLGIDMEAFKRLSPAQQMQEIAKGLDKFEDGAGKSAVAVALLGKEGAQALPFLNDLAAAGELQAKVSTEQAAAAANLDDNITRLATSGDAWKKELLSGMVPALDLGAQALLDVMNGTGGMRAEVKRLTADGSIREWTKNAITGLTYLADGVQYVIRLLKVGGESIGAYAAAAAVSMGSMAEFVRRLTSGDMNGAVETLKTGMRGAGEMVQTLGGTVQAAFSEETMGSRIRARMAEIEATGDKAEAAKPRLDFSNVIEKTKKAAKEAKDPVDGLIESIEKRTALYAAELAGEEKLTEGQKAAVEVLEQLRSGKVKVTQAESARIGVLLEAMLVAEKEVKAHQLTVQQLEAERAARVKVMETMEQSVGKLLESNDELEREIELIGLTERQQTAVLRARSELVLVTKRATLAELERRDAISGTMSREQIALAAEIEQLERRNVLLDKKQVREEEFQGWTSMWQSVDQTAHDVFVNVFEDGAGTFKRLGQTLKASLLDLLYQMTIRPWIISIVASLKGSVGSEVVNGLTGGGAGGMASGASNLYNLVTGGFNVAASMGSKIATSELLSRYGSEAVQQMLGEFGAGMMNTSSLGGFMGAIEAGGAQLAGAVVGSVMNGFSGYGISRLISGGYQVNPWVDRIGGIASMIPGVGPIAGVISGAINRLFGRKLKDSGIEGTFGGDTGFEGRTYQYYKGGLFRSSKTKYGELDEDLRSGLADQFSAMKVGTAAMAETLGLGTAAIDNFTASIKVSFHGLSAEEIQKKLQEELDKVAESLASATLGTQEYTRNGETSVDTLVRLSSSLAATNKVFEQLGTTLYESSLAGGDMASQLVDLFGGIDKFTAAAGTFFQNFYSPEEQREAMKRQLQSQLDAVNLKLPDIDAADARAQYRALAEAQDRTTDAGRRAYAMLLQLAGAFASVTKEGDDAAARAAERTKSIADARAGLDERLLAAQGNDRAVLDLRRKQEYEALWKLDPALAELVAKIYALEDASKAAAEAAARAAEIQSKGFDLNQRLLIAEGKSREALDLRRKQEYDALWKLDPALAATVAKIWALEDASQAAADAAAAQAKAEADARTRVDRAWSSLQQAVQAEKTRLEAARSDAQAAVQAWRSVVDVARDGARALRGEVSSTAAMQHAEGWVFIEDALEAVLRGGAAPDKDALREAIAAARSGLDANLYATQWERDRDSAMLAGLLEQLETSGGRQLSAADKSVDALERQIKQLDTTLDYWQQQIALSRGEVEATLSVAEAIERLRLQVASSASKPPATGNGSGSGSGSGSGGGSTGTGGSGGPVWGGTDPGKGSGGSDGTAGVPVWGGTATGTTPAARYSRVRSGITTGAVWYDPIIDAATIARLDALAPVYHRFDGTGNLVGLAAAFRAAGGTIEDLSILSGNFEADWRKSFAAVGVPAFARGGVHAGGWAMVGEEGPELAYLPPARIYTAGETNRMLSAAGSAGTKSNRVEQLLETLVARVEALGGEETAKNVRDLKEAVDAVTEGPAVRTRVI